MTELLEKIADLTIGAAAPDFKLLKNKQDFVTLSSLRGKIVVLFFYPKDNTPGCTIEAKQFSEYLPKFKQFNAEIFGISRDSIRSHENFKNKCDLNIDLLSDHDGDTCRNYNVLGEKQMFGKTYIGIRRSTFIIDTDGTIKNAMYDIKIPGHVDAVLRDVISLTS